MTLQNKIAEKNKRKSLYKPSASPRFYKEKVAIIYIEKPKFNTNGLYAIIIIPAKTVFEQILWSLQQPKIHVKMHVHICYYDDRYFVVKGNKYKIICIVYSTKQIV